jgi:hypothetical protein
MAEESHGVGEVAASVGYNWIPIDVASSAQASRTEPLCLLSCNRPFPDATPLQSHPSIHIVIPKIILHCILGTTSNIHYSHKIMQYTHNYLKFTHTNLTGRIQ